MIKFSGVNHAAGAGSRLLGLGLTERNVALLMAGRPISVPLDDIGFADTQLLIVYGADEDAIKTELSPYLSPGTVPT